MAMLTLNPAVFPGDGRDAQSLETYAELARIIGVALYVEEPRAKPKRRGYDAETLRSHIAVEGYAQANDALVAEQCASRMRERAAKIAALEAMLAARLKVEEAGP